MNKNFTVCESEKLLQIFRPSQRHLRHRFTVPGKQNTPVGSKVKLGSGWMCLMMCSGRSWTGVSVSGGSFSSREVAGPPVAERRRRCGLYQIPCNLSGVRWKFLSLMKDRLVAVRDVTCHWAVILTFNDIRHPPVERRGQRGDCVRVKMGVFIASCKKTNLEQSAGQQNKRNLITFQNELDSVWRFHFIGNII